MERDSIIHWPEIEPLCVIRLLANKLWLIILAALTGVMAASIVMTAAVSQTYSCSITFAVTSRSSGAYYSNVNAATEVAAIYSKLLGSSVMEKTVQTALGSEGTGTVSARQLGSTNLIEVTASAKTPREALLVINAVRENYRELSDYVSSSAVLSVLNDPSMAVVPTRVLNEKKICVLSGVGCALAMAAALFWIFLSRDTIQNAEGAKNKLDARIIAEIPHEAEKKNLRQRLVALRKRDKTRSSLLIVSPAISFGFAEAIHRIAARFEHKKAEGKTVFMFSSVSESEGKSTAAGNTALSLAVKGAKVLFIDLDLRRPVQNEAFGVNVPESAEFGALLAANASERDILDAAIRDEKSGLYMLLSTKSYTNMIELLSARRLGDVISLARERFDYIVIDSPPLGYFSDSEIIADISDASVLVVRQDTVPAPDINDAIDSLRACRAEFLGCVLNDMQHLLRNLSSYGYGYYGYGKYGYGKYGRYGKNGNTSDKGHKVRPAE